jgi:hypothetical protein
MFYFAAPQTIMGLYASSRTPDHPVTVLYIEPLGLRVPDHLTEHVDTPGGDGVRAHQLEKLAAALPDQAFMRT